MNDIQESDNNSFHHLMTLTRSEICHCDEFDMNVTVWWKIIPIVNSFHHDDDSELKWRLITVINFILVKTIQSEKILILMEKATKMTDNKCCQIVQFLGCKIAFKIHGHPLSPTQLTNGAWSATCYCPLSFCLINFAFIFYFHFPIFESLFGPGVDIQNV